MSWTVRGKPICAVIMPTDTSFLGINFHFPDKKYAKSEPYVLRRQDITIQYSNLLAWILVAVVVSIPVVNTLRANGYWVFNHIHVLRSTNHILDWLTKRSVLSDRVAMRFRNLASTVYLNHGTAFQIGLWVTVFIGLCSVNLCGGDIMFLGKRLGRLCVVSLPTVFFLTLRPSPLPRTLYLSLLPIHKWLSRAVVLLALGHTVIYCMYFVHNKTLFKAWKPANLFGWAAVLGFFFLALTSLLRVRDRAYKVFFFNHYFWSWVIVLCLPFHVRPVNTTYANTANVALLLYQAFVRVRMTLLVSQRGDFRVMDVSPNMAVIEFPNAWLRTRANNPGAHLRITNWHPNIIVRLFKFLIPNFHPYTLVTLPLDRFQRLIVRKGAFVWDTNRRYISYGTFDPKLLFIDSTNTTDLKFSISKLTVKAKKMLIVVGGSAISFAIPILRVANYHGIPIKVVWILRDYRDLAVLKCFEGFVHGDEFEIFVTGGSGVADSTKAATRQPSYGTFKLASKQLGLDLEQNESSLLNSDARDEVPVQEFENVDVDFIETEEDAYQEECQNTFNADNTQLETFSINSNDSHEVQAHGFDDFLPQMDRATSMSRKSSTSGFNEQFTPNLDSSNPRDNDYIRTVQDLHLEHRIYKGRPVLNFRYLNWCQAANDTFTQCSGPVMDEESNLVCCKDLPERQHMISAELNPADLAKVWVISAGPKSLVKNTRLWANENGLKYHEEAFYV